MRMASAAPLALGMGMVALVGCGGTAKKPPNESAAGPYRASTTIACLRNRVAAALQPSRTAAREVRRGSEPDVVAYVGRSGSTIGLTAAGGDYQITLEPSEENVDFHFARSGREASSLLREYRSNLRPQVGENEADQLVFRRRNVVEEWNETAPTLAEQRTADQCLTSRHAAAPSTHKWHPAPVPSSYVGAFAPAKVRRLNLVPRDAEPVQTWRIYTGGGIPPQVALAWQRTSVVGSDFDTGGVVIWQRIGQTARWRRVYSLIFPANRVLGVGLHTGDVNGDQRADLLLFEDTDGSAGCGIYRLLANLPGRIKQLAVRQACEDNAAVSLQRGALVMYDGIVKDRRTLEDIHCCWSVWLRTEMRWRGGRLVRVRTSRTGPPPRSRRTERPLTIQ